VYENEDGDYWVRLDQAATEAEALTAVQAAWQGMAFISLGVETVNLSEHEWGDHSHGPGRRRRAWHFQDSEL
jgi:hypothetical protein